MSFFEPPTPPPDFPEPEEFDEPEWFGPPRNELGVAIPLRFVLARTDDLAIAITEATAYTGGFELKLVRRSRERPSYPDFDDFDMDHPMMWHRLGEKLKQGELPPELFRFGIEFSDGTKATTVGSFPHGGDFDKKPEGPVLWDRGGGGGGGDWDNRYWVWPLPPEGTIAFVCEWPAKGIPLTRQVMDASTIREAGAQVEMLWEDPGGPRLDSGGGHMFLVGRSDAEASEPAEETDEESE